MGATTRPEGIGLENRRRKRPNVTMTNLTLRDENRKANVTKSAVSAHFTVMIPAGIPAIMFENQWSEAFSALLQASFGR